MCAMKNKFYLLIFCGSLLQHTAMRAQTGLFIDTSFTAEQMVIDFFSNSCATPQNITFSGAPLSMGYFEAATTDLGVNAGLVLATGKVDELAYPSSVFYNGYIDIPPYAGDSDLSTMAGWPTYDAAVLEFDLLVAEDGELDFRYIFGSEEYPEFANTNFNDIFSFWVGEVGTTPENIAMVPGHDYAVSINTINADSNAVYYINYEGLGGQSVVFDGLTTLLPASFTATAGTLYHVKIAIADVSDAAFGSAVFIGTQSLCGQLLVVPPALAQASVDDLTASFQNTSRYATSWHWDFGDGAVSDLRDPGTHTYSAPGVYTVQLITHNWCCADTLSFPVTVGTTVGTEEATPVQIHLVPNPATAYVSIPGDGSLVFDFQLANAAGVGFMRGTIANNGEQLYLGGLSSGYYLLSLKNDHFAVTKKLFVR